MTAESILRDMCELVYLDMARGNDCAVQANLAVGILWDARKYLGCYPWDVGKVAVPGLYTDKHFAEKRITCGYCGESYVADGGWYCPHCGGC